MTSRLPAAVLALIVAMTWAGLAAAVSVQDTAQAPDLSAAKQAFQANLKLGSSLAGRPASDDQVAEAQRLFDEALAGARTAISAWPESAEAHWLAGAILSSAYRPVVVNPGGATQSGGKAKPRITVLLRGAAGDCAEGLAEIRAALELTDSAPDYVLDYAEAMLTCGDLKGAEQQATSVWDKHSSLSKQQAIRCARLLAECARASKITENEINWLGEVLKLDPKDRAARDRLTKLANMKPGTVTWNSYETGMGLAARLNKPMLIDFSTEWCGWCKKLEKEVFPTSEFISAAQSYVCIKVDGDARRDLVGKHKVEGYPTTLLLDPTGRELDRIVGYETAKDYAADLRKALPRR